ncbi:polysaccharide deacetylase family protein [Arthrobacter sp. H16F315]|uniref:polysaccharide deacetylase family protein n=1 Tax=Arthrobacter sp. H16F315 TaxID=2955314 RepID=UPI0020975CC1|nr:polysaccharide deacetylase family protein [Arthrobacter sp. H16F315]MDD1477205.1 polysaccharide deacetylase family protein [Arthrobacter sp. H16F315]
MPASAATAATIYPFTPNTALVDAFVARRGGVIGTGGKTAIAFRCDHHLNQFESRLLPLHQKYGIPVTIAAMSQMFRVETGTNGSTNLSFPRLQALALANGLEIANHGATHTDADTSQRLREEIVYSRNALTASLPKLPLELFIPPGVGGTQYLGFAGGKTQDSFQKYLAGRLITQQHAMSTGYVPGYWPMTGNPLDSMGNVHVGIENADYARRGPDFIAAARRQGRGVCFMYHPSLVDDIDLEAIDGFFAWCSRERDAGRLEILTTTGLMMSSFSTSSRHDLLSATKSFVFGWNGWNGSAANWARRTDSGVTYARRGALSLPLFKDVPVGASAGSARQLRILMRSTTGVRVKVEVLDPANPGSFTAAKTVTLPPAAGFQQAHQYVVLPLTGTPLVRVRITPLSGGELHVQEPRLLAA